MDISSILQFIIGAAVALALGWLGWQEWGKSSHEQRLAIVERVVLAIEEHERTSQTPGALKLIAVMDRLRELFPGADIKELDEMVHATVAKLNAVKQAGATGRGISRWVD